jgi:hypothetical protein
MGHNVFHSYYNLYLPFVGNSKSIWCSGWNTEVASRMPLNSFGTLTAINLTVWVQTAPTDNVVFTIYLNGVATGLTVTLPAGQTKAISSVGASATLSSIYDLVSLNVNSLGGTLCEMGYSIETTELSGGYCLFLGGSNAAYPQSPSVTNYSELFNNTYRWAVSAPTTTTAIRFNPMTIKAIGLVLTVAPGTGKSVTFALYKNGVPVASVTISGTSLSNGNYSFAIF